MSQITKCRKCGNADSSLIENKNGQAFCLFCNSIIEGVSLPKEKISTKSQVVGGGIAKKPQTTYIDNPDVSGAMLIDSYKKHSDSILKINAFSSITTKKQRASSGSGFILTDSIILTNAHVVIDEKKEEVFPNITGMFNPKLEKDMVVLQCCYINKDEDLAILKVKKGEPLVGKLELDDSDNYEVGEGIVTIGNPLSIEFAQTPGNIMATPTKYKGMSYSELFVLASPITYGNSGGAVISLRTNKVIGISTSTPIQKSVQYFTVDKKGTPELKTLDITSGGIGYAITSKTIKAEIAKYRSKEDME